MRIWPRGISKDKVDGWMKDLGTEREMIKRWKTGKISWEDFSKEYRKGLGDKKALLQELAQESKKEDVTLLCSCKDVQHCHRSLLAKEIEKIKA